MRKSGFFAAKKRRGSERITAADFWLIVGHGSINFQSDLRIVGQKRPEGPMKKVSPRSP